MSSSTIENFASLASLVPDEIITHSLLEDVVLPGGATLALLTLDNGFDHTKPTTLGPNTLLELHAALTAQKERAAAGEIAALAVTGKPYFLVAGADLNGVKNLASPEHGAAMA